MNDGRLEQERERAQIHPARWAMLKLLRKSELTSPEVKGRLPESMSLSEVSYHLRVLERATLVDCAEGVYRLSSPPPSGRGHRFEAD